MKAYFDDKGNLCVDAEGNTEAVALRLWDDLDDKLRIMDDAHLRVTTDCVRGD